MISKCEFSVALTFLAYEREILDDYILLLRGGDVTQDPELVDRKKRTGYYFSLGEHIASVILTIFTMLFIIFLSVLL